MKFIAEFVRVLNFLPIFIAIFHKPYGDVLYCTARFFRPAVPGGRIGPAARGSIGAVLALVCYGSSVYLAFRDFGPVTGTVVILVILVLSVIATVVSLRAKTWQRFSLKQEIRSSSMPVIPAEELQVGDRGVTLSRLSPMGKVEIGGRTYEAKSQGAYVDQQRDVEVVGFENFSVIVKTIK